MALVLPPKFAHAPTAVVYDAHLPDPLFRTYIKLAGLAWQDKSHGHTRLPDCTLDELAAICQLPRRTLQLHLAQLRNCGLLHVRRGQYTLQIVLVSEAQGAASDAQKLAHLTPEPPSEAQNFAHLTANNDAADIVVRDSTTTTSSSSKKAPEAQGAASEAQKLAHLKATLAALQAHGVTDTPEARAVAALPHVTPALVHARAAELAQRPGVRNLPGLLLYTLSREPGTPSPVTPPSTPTVDLPAEVLAALSAVGWVGSTEVVAAAYTADPDRVLAWVRYATDANAGYRAREQGITNRAAVLRRALAGPTWPPATGYALPQATTPAAEDPPPDAEDQAAPAVAPPPAEPEPTLTLADGTTQPAAQLWQRTLTELELQMTRATFDTWLRDSACIGLADATTLTVQVKNQYAVEWLENRLAPVIRRTLQRLAGQALAVTFITA